MSELAIPTATPRSTSTLRRKARGPAPSATVATGASRYLLRMIVFAYLFFLTVLPIALIFWRTFDHGVGSVWRSLTSHDVRHALMLTAEVAVIAVAIDVVFGVGAALLLVRHRFPGRHLMSALIDLPLAVSPVVVGLALILVYGANGWFGGWLQGHGVQVIFATPGMVLATVFVSLPLVVREVVPVLEEIGTEQEQAAATLGARSFQTFRRVTLPAISGALAYGTVLSLARCIGEYGAVVVVAGNQIGSTQTATLAVQQSFENFDPQTAYAVAFLLAVAAVVALLVATLIRPAERAR